MLGLKHATIKPKSIVGLLGKKKLALTYLPLFM
jgi:hypothetical protein